MNSVNNESSYKRLLEELEPKRVFYHFENLCRIPHGSGNEEGVSRYCEAVAAANGLRCVRDASNNTIIYVPATADYEAHPTVIIQGHLDMVCAKREGTDIDMSTQPLRLCIYPDGLGAEDTSLGGDDGIAVAYCLALAESKSIKHPPLELLLTTDEEVGMSGAAALDGKLLSGRTLINLDSDEEGVFTVGCAGGLRVYTSMRVNRAPFRGECAELTVTGLCGGHSGTEINKGRANSNAVMGRLLKKIAEITELHILYLEGGEKDNVITSHTTAGILFDKNDCSAVIRAVAEFRGAFLRKYAAAEPNALISLGLYGYSEKQPLDRQSSQRAVGFLSSAPFGVMKMSPDTEGLVQTSLNIGKVKLHEDRLEVDFSVRSSLTVERDELAYSLVKLAEKYGAEAQRLAPYPAWEYRKASKLRDTMTEVYRRLNGTEPVISVIHAGLECGLLSQKLPGLDAVSFGPNMRNIHSCEERLDIGSVARIWNFLQEVLAAL